MIERDAKFLYLSSSIAAVLTASRLQSSSLKKIIVSMFAILNLEIVFGIFAMIYGYKVFTITLLIIAVLTLLWSGFQINRIVRIESDSQAILLRWSQELDGLSGDIVDVKASMYDTLDPKASGDNDQKKI